MIDQPKTNGTKLRGEIYTTLIWLGVIAGISWGMKLEWEDRDDRYFEHHIEEKMIDLARDVGDIKLFATRLDRLAQEYNQLAVKLQEARDEITDLTKGKGKR